MKAYEGNENYIFVSYAHADGNIVVPIIEAMQSAGFRVWYDLGIEAGTEWPAYIEDHLNRCSRIIAFISPSAVESFNCRTEINYALMKKKEMLVIYLEETELKYGLGLQLNSIQSLYKYRHQTTKTFYGELMAARILQCCKLDGKQEDFVIPDDPISGGNNTYNDLEKALASGNRARIKASRSSKPSALSTVGIMPSNDPSNHWPTGSYTQVIDEDRFSVVHFHCRFIKPIPNDGNREIGIMIFDGDDNLVYDNRVTIDFDKGNDRFSTRWIISDSNGLKQKAGDYTAIIWVDDSSVYEYSFRLTSSNGFTGGGIPTPPVHGGNNNDTTATPAHIEKLKDKLMYPKLARRHLTAFWLLVFAIGLSSGGGDEIAQVFGLVAMVGALWAYITLWKLSNNHLIKNKVGTAIVMTIGFVYYGIFLCFAGIYSAFNRTKWKIQILQYEREHQI